MDLKQVAIEGITYDIAKYVFMSLVVGLAGTFLASRVINTIENWKDTIYFFGTIFVVVFMGLFLFSPRTQTPKLAAGIESVVLGGTNDGKDAIAVINMTVMNIGSMQSIVKGWQVEARLDGHVYKGGFMTRPPKEFTFTSLNPEPGAATAIIFHSEDNLLEKAIVPIQPGGLATGILYVLFPRLDANLFRSGADYTIKLQDVMSNEYSTSITATAQQSAFASMPGTHSDLVCPVPTAKLPLPPLPNVSVPPVPPILPFPENPSAAAKQ